MTIGQYLLLSLLTFSFTIAIGYYLLIAPRLRKNTASPDLTDTDTDYHTAQLYRVEGRQILVIPRECELDFNNIKLRRVSGVLMVYPQSLNGSELAERILAKAPNPVDDNSRQQ